MRIERAILVGAFLSAAAIVALLRPEPVCLVYKVWNAVPGSVVDEEGRIGQLYSNGAQVLYVVVFEKNCHPRHAGPLDRVFIPPPSRQGIHAQITFDTKSLQCGTGNSDEIFDGFLLSQNRGVGWNGDGVEAVKLDKTGPTQSV